MFPQTVSDPSSGKAAPYGGMGIGLHGCAMHVRKMTHGAYWALGMRAPPHFPLKPVSQQLRPEAQSPADEQLAPAPCFVTVAVTVAVAAAVVVVAVAVSVAVCVGVAVAVAVVVSVLLEVVGAIVTVAVD